MVAEQELEQELADRVPEQLASRVQILPPLLHIWLCFWDLDSTRPIKAIPAGLGVSIPLQGALPWDRVSAWLDERGIHDLWERNVIRGHLRTMDAEFQDFQAQGLSKAAEVSDEDSDG